ncbi:MAG: MFS transporter, partial [Clostridia bacterium]|nr:MFS transporter [Clostridia bacterium]
MKKAQRNCLTVTLLLGMMFLAAIFTLQGALLTSLIAHYNVSDSVQGFASSAASIGGVVALVSSFFLIGKLSKLLLLRLAVAACALFLALLKLSPTFALFVAMWFALGIGMGYLDMLVSSCMADLYEGRAATRMMCILHTSYGIVSSIVPVVYGGMLSSGIMWNNIYLYVAAAGAALLVLFIFAMRYARTDKREEPTAENRLSLGDMRRIMSKGVLPALVCAMFCQGIYLGGFNTWIERYVSVTLGSSLGSLSLSLMFFGVMLSRLILAFAPISPVKYIRYAGIASGMFLLAALPFKSGLIMCIGMCASGICFGAFIPCTLDVGCALTPESSMFATTAMMLAVYLGQAVAPPVIGALGAAFGLHAG